MWARCPGRCTTLFELPHRNGLQPVGHAHSCKSSSGKAWSKGAGRRSSATPSAPWAVMTDDELLAHLPEIAAVASQVEERLNAWVGTARERRISWARIGASLGMTRQSAWERFQPPR